MEEDRDKAEDERWQAEVRAGLDEIDSGIGIGVDQFEREMEAFMRALRAKRG